MAVKQANSKPRLSNKRPREQDLTARMFRRSMLWQPDRIAQSAWLEHVPFAFWIVDVFRPKRIVELGTHFGVSYSAMCQAVKRLGLATSCFAIDTWKGDEQAGFYDESVFHEFSEFHDQYYGGFSRLVRSTFDEALAHFGNETIDLLHIDGLHTYEAVRHDYESWRQKLSANSIVLFHDTNVREGDFGVFRFWRELTQGHLHFNFLHGHGLGVLGFGDNFSTELKLLFRANEDDQLCAAVRDSFQSMGRSVHLLFDLRKLHETVAVNASEIGALRGQLVAHQNHSASLHENITQRDREVVSLNHELAVRASEIEALRQQILLKDNERIELAHKLAERNSKELKLEKELAVQSSESETLRERLLANDNKFAEFKGKIAERDKKVLMLEKQLVVLSREVDTREKRLSDFKCEFSALQDEISDRARRISSLVEGITEKDQEIADFRRSAAEKDRRIDYLESVVRALYTSTSWRVTAPLRAMRRAFNKEILEPVVPSQKAVTLLASTSFPKRCASSFRLVYISSEWKTPGHTYRVMQMVDAARLIGLEASWIKLEVVPVHLAELSNADAVIFWRTAWDPCVEAAMGVARQSGARIIFDVDDLMFEPDFARTSMIDGIRTQGLTEDQVRTHYALVQRAMLQADICTTTTEEIAWYMRNAGKVTFVIPNSFGYETVKSSRLAVRRRRKMTGDGVVRIGYAAGTRTHQRDFATIANAIGRILHERPQCRLVLFREKNQGPPLVDISEYSALAENGEQIEWREYVAPEDLAEEMARFDLNLAPLEVGNPFCEAKSELKFFEASLVDVVTIASPTGPFRRAIRNGETGFLASDENEWHDIILRLIDDPNLRRNVARAARYDATRQFGTIHRTKSLENLVAQLIGDREAARAFELQAMRTNTAVAQLPELPEAEVIFDWDNLRPSEVTVIVPVFNYAHHIVDALESVLRQTLSNLDLVVIDDCSTDNSVEVALDWAKRNASRFNRLRLLRNCRNAGLGPSRNVGFDEAETPYVLPLDADNRLLPPCCERLLSELRNTDLAFAYPVIRQFEGGSELISALPFEPQRFVGCNYIDAMALISKEAWVCVGGYANISLGWEDYDFWCSFVDYGLRGKGVNDVLAEYRLHANSMLRTITERPENKRILLDVISRRHKWLALIDRKKIETQL